MMHYVKGDLFESGEKVIAHGCNTFGLMGAGVAGEVAKRFPYVKERYKKAVDARVFVLGYAQFVIDEKHDVGVYNLATQREPGANGSYWGVYLSFCNMFEHAKSFGLSRIAIPKIGAGIAKLDWLKVEDMINEAYRDVITPDVYKLDLVVYEL